MSIMPTIDEISKLFGLFNEDSPLNSILRNGKGGGIGVIIGVYILAMAGAGQVGVAIAIYLKAKKVGNGKLQQVIAGALPAGVLGIGEPLIYGVTLPMGKSFITAGLGAGFGGAYVMLTHVMATAWGPSGLVAIPLMQPASMFNYFIGLVIAYIGGFVITQFAIKEKEVLNV